MSEETRGFENKEEGVVSDLFDNYNDTQREILEIETNKTRNKLFSIAAVLLIANLIGTMMLKVPLSAVLFDVLIIPVVIFGLAFLAIKEPLAAISLAALIIIGVWVYNIIILGGFAIISGWLIKAIVIYLLIAGFQNGREAHRIRKELDR